MTLEELSKVVAEKYPEIREVRFFFDDANHEDDHVVFRFKDGECTQSLRVMTI